MIKIPAEAAIQSQSDPIKAIILQRFFKTGPGDYGEGDVFIGVVVPKIRSIVRQYWKTTSFEDCLSLLHDKVHEKRLLALLLLLEKSKKGDMATKKRIHNLFLANLRYVNNWDLVDLSCCEIVGEYLQDKDRSILYSLAESKALWERRIAIVSCYAFIRKGDLTDTFSIAKILLEDKHDLIQKAVGWMLREAGKRDEKKLKIFLDDHLKAMPRTMLRYAIEKFPEILRKQYLAAR